MMLPFSLGKSHAQNEEGLRYSIVILIAFDIEQGLCKCLVSWLCTLLNNIHLLFSAFFFKVSLKNSGVEKGKKYFDVIAL